MTTPSKTRAVVVLGAGVLGRRIASLFLAGGYTVHIRDPSPQALADAVEYIDAHRADFTAAVHSKPSTQGSFEVFTELPAAVVNAWLVIEAVPEKLPLKVSTFAEVDRATPADCIIASNSSSFKSRLMVDEISVERRKKVLNMHFTMPPDIRTVELMTDGETEEELFPMLSDVLRECGTVPVTARRESTGFIFNRLWAAIKREILLILAEDVSSAEEIDLLWENMFHLPNSLPPCRLIDKIGLDTVAFIEDNYIQERGLDGRMTVDWLREHYISAGRSGLKSNKGGLYEVPASDALDKVHKDKDESVIYVLDVGLGSNNADISKIPTCGKILQYRPSSGKTTPIVTGQSLPDGIDVSKSTGRIFWTNMGHATSTYDGSVHSATLDGQDVRTVLASGAIHTPKQLVVDDETQHVYFCDREGMSVHRVKFDGSGHEVLVRTGDVTVSEHNKDQTRWCVGITLDKRYGYVYWTQKGPSKGVQGRIFRAGIDIPAGQTAEDRSDVEVVLVGLPEPIDLEFDSEEETLYWTDRGEHPTGSSLNRVVIARGMVDSAELENGREILARHFNEPIGLKLNADRKLYVTDLGGSLYSVDGGKKTVVWSDSGCYTGITIV